MAERVWRKAAIQLRANAPWRRALPNRTVRRRVQGVDLYLPWSHRLPDYARARPEYGQNLVQLAGLLGDRLHGAPLRVLDVGANVGDSALQILARTDARVLCVEGDPYWIGYLNRNVGGEPRVTVAEVFLDHPGSSWSGAAPVRTHGTTRFVEDAAAATGVETVPVTVLRERHPEFAALRLVKSDTDGLDTALVPAIASAWADCGPVLFFEFDPRLTEAAGFADPSAVWDSLAALGYARAAAWDNGGAPLGQFDLADGRAKAAVLGRGAAELGYHFWDVAVRRADDTAAAEAFDALVPRAL